MEVLDLHIDGRVVTLEGSENEIWVVFDAKVKVGMFGGGEGAEAVSVASRAKLVNAVKAITSHCPWMFPTKTHMRATFETISLTCKVSPRSVMRFASRVMLLCYAPRDAYHTASFPEAHRYCMRSLSSSGIVEPSSYEDVR